MKSFRVDAVQVEEDKTWRVFLDRMREDDLEFEDTLLLSTFRTEAEALKAALKLALFMKVRVRHNYTEAGDDGPGVFSGCVTADQA